MTFSKMGLRPEILEAIAGMGFEEPTPIQAEVIPHLLDSQRDIVGLAQTGTGKTAAFGLPLLQQLELKSAVPQALVLCPTRELCMQISKDMQNFASRLPNARILAVYGGTDIRPQLSALRRGVHVLVATPGRMLDVLRREAVDFGQISKVVLDEADEMLNMGFQEELEGILAEVPDDAQTLLFSATMPREVEKIARKYMEKPVEITVGQRNAGAENVSHEYYVVQAKNRYHVLRRIVDIYPRMYGIVFCRTRIETQQVADKLGVDGYNAEPLHGDLSQQQRDNVMRKFRDRHLQILVATDVAARGLDVTDLSHVINYNLPDELNAYTHRTGRTGRAGKEGIAVAIVHSREQFKIKRLERLIGKSFERRQVPSGEDVSRVRVMNLGQRVLEYRSDSNLLTNEIADLCDMLDDLPKEEIIKRFVSIELHRLLHFYKGAPDLNADSARGERRQRDRSDRRPGRDRAGARGSQPMVSLVMNVGSQNGLKPADLMSLVNAADRNSSIEIGRIKIVRQQSYFEVPEDQAQNVLDAFGSTTIELDGRPVGVAQAGVGYARKPRHKGRGQGGTRRNR
jgi:ATP-dependent RNA helicase DeaD